MTEEEVQQQLALLKNSYEMYERSKVDMLKVRKEKTDKNGNRIYTDKSAQDTLQLMETMQQDIKEQYLQLGGKEEDLKKHSRKGIDRKALEAIMKKEKAKDDMRAYMEKMNAKNAETPVESIKNSEPTLVQEEPQMPAEEPVLNQNEPLPSYSQNEEKPEQEVKADYKEGEPEEPVYHITAERSMANGNRTQYDLVPLPSHGECYKKKLRKIPVSYLTAYDENLIVSPNLYNDGSFLNELLKSKMMDSTIDTDDLLPGDRDAIILWLRATGYGPEFPVTATDNETGKQFDTVVDLTQINYKPFKLKGDANGNFEYILPNSKDVVKFKFLSYRDIEALEREITEEDAATKKAAVETITDRLSNMVEGDSNLNSQMRIKLNEALKTLKSYSDSITEGDASEITHSITNKLIKSIVAINGITDRKYINDYVMFMDVRDSSALRRYIQKNEPGLDFNVQVERPESLGGGSVSMFLTFDQYLFLNLI